MNTQMSRNEIIAKVKELGIETEKAPNLMKTVVLQELLDANTAAIEDKVEEAVVEEKVLGRKINPNSERQKRLAAIEAARLAAGGELPKGRKVDLTSTRQMRIAAREAALAAGLLAKGRPVNENSARQQKFAERQAIIEAGGTIQRGRPKAIEKPLIPENEIVGEDGGDGGSIIVDPILQNKNDLTVYVAEDEDETEMFNETSLG
jgi:hypothetical protein